MNRKRLNKILSKLVEAAESGSIEEYRTWSAKFDEATSDWRKLSKSEKRIYCKYDNARQNCFAAFGLENVFSAASKELGYRKEDYIKMARESQRELAQE